MQSSEKVSFCFRIELSITLVAEPGNLALMELIIGVGASGATGIKLSD
jgi:hypothetical protein